MDDVVYPIDRVGDASGELAQAIDGVDEVDDRVGKTIDGERKAHGEVEKPIDGVGRPIDVGKRPPMGGRRRRVTP